MVVRLKIVKQLFYSLTGFAVTVLGRPAGSNGLYDNAAIGIELAEN